METNYLASHPSLRTLLILLEYDNGTPAGFFDVAAEEALQHTNPAKLAALATKALNTPLPAEYNPLEGIESVADLLVFYDHDTKEAFLQTQPQYYPLDVFLELSFGEMDLEDIK